MRDDEVRISPPGRADLSKIRKQDHEWYLGSEDPDGTIILVPAVLVPARRITEDPAEEGVRR